jgi:hypothetical protein
MSRLSSRGEGIDVCARLNQLLDHRRKPKTNCHTEIRDGIAFLSVANMTRHKASKSVDYSKGVAREQHAVLTFWTQSSRRRQQPGAIQKHQAMPVLQANLFALWSKRAMNA